MTEDCLPEGFRKIKMNENCSSEIVRKIKLIANYLDYTHFKYPNENGLLSKELIEIDDLASKVVDLIDFEEKRKQDIRTEEGKELEAKILNYKKEYEERKNLRKDTGKISRIVMTQLHEDNGCELRVIAILRGKDDDFPDKKQSLRDALIEHFEDLLKYKENPMYERILANIEHETFKEEFNKKHKEEN